VPALPPAPKVLRIQYKFNIAEDLGALCRLFYQYTGAGATAGELATLCTAIGVSFTTYGIPLMTTDRGLESVGITDLSSPTAPAADVNINSTGTRAGDFLPASTCIVESGEIVRRYRGGHPRVYWPFGAFADLHDAQTWDSGFVTEVTTALAAHQADWFGSAPVDLGAVNRVNVSYYAGFTPHIGVTGRYRNVPTPRLAPVIDTIVSELVREGVGQIRRRLLHLA